MYLNLFAQTEVNLHYENDKGGKLNVVLEQIGGLCYYFSFQKPFQGHFNKTISIRPKYTWGPNYGFGCLQLTATPCCDLTLWDSG